MNTITPRYRIVQVGRKLRGITSPRAGRVSAILKLNGPESPSAIYNEIVAVRLGRLLGVPLADGVLGVRNGEHMFASLELAETGLPLPPVRKNQLAEIARRYPDEAAALTLFDIWIGNFDRGLNMRALLASEERRLICGFDHGHALLNVKATIPESLAALSSHETLVPFHPFYGELGYWRAHHWIDRLAELEPSRVLKCCLVLDPLTGVGSLSQERLATVLSWRAREMSIIVNRARPRIIRS